MTRADLELAERFARTGRPLEAEWHCRQALRANPGNVRAALLLGRVSREAGRQDESVRILSGLRLTREHDPRVAGELGASLVKSRRHAEAIPLLRRAAGAMPDEPEWLRWLGRAYLRAFRPGAAAAQFLAALRLDPACAETRLLLANAHIAGGRARDAAPLLAKLLEERPDWTAAQSAMGQAQEHMSAFDRALAAYGAASTGDNEGLAIAGIVRCLLAQGHHVKALAASREAHRARPTVHTALALARALLAWRMADDARDVLERAIAETPAAGAVESAVWFALGDSRDQVGDYDGAFEAYRRANALYPRTFSRERLLARHQAWAERVHPALDGRGVRVEIDASPCVFIVGMPRSGTTLVEQILDCHPMVRGCGELPTLGLALRELAEDSEGPYPDALSVASVESLAEVARAYLAHLRSFDAGAARLSDKLPHNFELLGMIERVLPGARVIHCMRQPIDTCLSCFRTQLSPLHDYATDLANLGAAYGAYERLVRHWRATLDLPLLEVRYEDLVADPAAQARRLVEFVGVSWDDACAQPWTNSRTVATASVDQVRRPIYTSSVRRYERYRRHLGPLVESLHAEGVATA